jgi:hypothetical protein
MLLLSPCCDTINIKNATLKSDYMQEIKAQLKIIRLFFKPLRNERSQYKNVCRSILLLLFFSGLTSGYAQSLSKYRGNLVTQFGLDGYANYTYYVKDTDTVRHGDFYFLWSQKDSVNSDYIINISFEGKYNHGQKHGLWKYHLKNLKPVDKPNIKDREITYSASGTVYEIIANFNRGKPDNGWSVVQHNINSSESGDTTYAFFSSFKDGKMTGSISGFSNGTKFSGQSNQFGKLDNLWIFAHNIDGNVIREFRNYDDGMLNRHFFMINSDTVEIERIIRPDVESYVNVPYNDMYVRYIELTTIGKSIRNTVAAEQVNKTSKTLADALVSTGYHHNREIWKSFSDTIRFRPADVRLPYIPYTVEERKKVVNTKKTLQDQKKKIEKFFSNPQTEVSRYSYEDITFYHEVMKIYRNVVNRLEKTMGILADTAVQFIPRDDLMPYILPKLTFSDNVSYVYKEDTLSREHKFPRSLDSTGTSFETFMKYMDTLTEAISKTVDKVNPILSRLERKEKITDKELLFIVMKDSVVNLFSDQGKRKDYNLYHREVSTKMVMLAEEQIKSYVGLSIEDKIDQIENYLDCMEHALKLYTIMAGIPKKAERVDDLYMRTVWNPYTYTDMHERMKERLYKAYEYQIFPYVIENIRNTITCGNIEAKNKNINAVYNRMVQLREQDTKELERQIRRARGTEEVIRIFDADGELNLN